jgi:hypothetical protein
MRPLTGGRFVVTVVWRTAAFVAISFGFPYIVSAIQSATNCASSQGGCFAVAALSGTALRLAILALFALSLVRPIWRRAGTLGMPRSLGLAVPVLLVLDWKFLTTLGGYWRVSFSGSLLNSGLPFFTVLAVLIILFLAIAPTPVDRRDTLWRRHRVAGEAGWFGCLGTAVLGAVSAGLFIAWLASLATIGMMSPFAADALRVAKAAYIVALAAMVPFVWLILIEGLGRPARRAPPPRSSQAPPAGEAP